MFKRFYKICKYIRLFAQRGRYGKGVTGEELAEIYELTYKLQMLEQEEKYGDYGVPSVLSDKAYIEKAKVEAQLEEKMDEVYEVMVSIYDGWIEGHRPSAEDFYDDAWEEWSYFREEIETGQRKIDAFLDPDKVYSSILDTLQKIIEEEGREEEFRESTYDKWQKYLESKGTKRAQQKQLEFMDEEEVSPIGIQKPLDEMDLDEIMELPLYKENEEFILNTIEEQPYFMELIDSFAKMRLEMAEDEDDNSPYASVKIMREDMEEWDTLFVGDKIKLFQEALTVMHNNGEMAEYLLDDPDAGEILNRLSAGEHVEEWDRELSKLLGYPLGSKMVPKSDWYVPAFLKKMRRKMQASAIDYVREELDQEIWNISGEQVSLQPKVQDQIEDIVYSAIDDLDLPDNSVKDIFIYGSILSNQYNSETDVDARVVLDPEIVYEKYGEKITGDDLFDLTQDTIHGILLADTKHPFNATIIIEGEETELGQAPLGKTEEDPVYDVLNKKIINPPVYKEDFDPDEEFSKERDDVSEIMTTLDELMQETRADSIDFKTMEDAVGKVKDSSKMEERMNKKLEEIQSSVEQLVEEYKKLKDSRTEAYQKGEKHRDSANLRFKMLEKYSYINVLRKLKRLLKGGISEEEIPEVEETVQLG